MQARRLPSSLVSSACDGMSEFGVHDNLAFSICRPDNPGKCRVWLGTHSVHGYGIQSACGDLYNEPHTRIRLN